MFRHIEIKSKLIKRYESQEQKALFKWAKTFSIQYPELELMFHIPNGGKRNIAEAKSLKLQGVKAGVPDIFLAVPRGIFHGLFIEMKVAPNKPTKKQLEWLENLNQKNYAVCVCYSWTAAQHKILRYLNIQS